MGTKGFWIWTIGAAVLVNVVDYGWGSKAHVGIGSTEFYAAVTVDLGLGLASVGVGTAAVWVLLAAVPGVGPVAVLSVFVVAQGSFTIASWRFGWREGALAGVTSLYEGVREQILSAPDWQSGRPGPLLR